MKILFFIDDFSGGAGKIVQILAHEFAQINNEVKIVLARQQSEPRFELSQITYTTIFANGKKSENNIIESAFAVRRIVIKEKPDVVISFITNTNVVVALACLGLKIPLVVSERSDPLHVRLTLKLRLLRLITYFRADTISVLFDVFKTFDFAIHRARCITTPNPVLKPPVVRSSKNKDQNDEFTMVTMSRLTPTKRVDQIVKAHAILSREFPFLRLKILGDGKELQRLIEQVKSLQIEPTVDFKGKVRNIYEELAQSDLYLMASKHEGFPNALVEAMSVGLPTVSYLCHEGLAELVQNGHNGFLVDDQNFDEYLNKIRDLINNPEKAAQIGREAEKISEKYSLQSTFLIWQQAIQQARFRRLGAR